MGGPQVTRYPGDGATSVSCCLARIENIPHRPPLSHPPLAPGKLLDGHRSQVCPLPSLSGPSNSWPQFLSEFVAIGL